MSSDPWDTVLRQLDRYRASLGIDCEQMDAAVAAWGFAAWEVGPYLDTDLVSFALSAGWDADALARAAEIIGTAPAVEGVIFTEAKPPKDWDRIFSLQTDQGPVDVDCRKIGFELARRTDDLVELSRFGSKPGSSPGNGMSSQSGSTPKSASATRSGRWWIAGSRRSSRCPTLTGDCGISSFGSSLTPHSRRT
jgi:hypothetical protein